MSTKPFPPFLVFKKRWEDEKGDVAEKGLDKIFAGQNGSNAFGLFSIYWSRASANPLRS
jgi:hypothetical protein